MVIMTSLSEPFVYRGAHMVSCPCRRCSMVLVTFSSELVYRRPHKVSCSCRLCSMVMMTFCSEPIAISQSSYSVLLMQHCFMVIMTLFYEQIASCYALAFHPCREEYLVVGMGCARLTLQLRRGSGIPGAPPYDAPRRICAQRVIGALRVTRDLS